MGAAAKPPAARSHVSAVLLGPYQPKQASFCVPPTGTSGTLWVRPCPC
jgi:hypothetical protein